MLFPSLPCPSLLKALPVYTVVRNNTGTLSSLWCNLEQRCTFQATCCLITTPALTHKHPDYSAFCSASQRNTGEKHSLREESVRGDTPSQYYTLRDSPFTHTCQRLVVVRGVSLFTHASMGHAGMLTRRGGRHPTLIT